MPVFFPLTASTMLGFILGFQVGKRKNSYVAYAIYVKQNIKVGLLIRI